ncbi:hypothetical protein HS088_TW22G00657 [Tripterygium wilfordii]|uniref:Peptidase S59 domain-containing protein n=1 Tax=Tripterygium wilfordii TaxID=458696 RepID=A0A7J7BYN3_TRIWF|nr:hypothetical protein HS088_TW22G00657 [Tripterygium wilfordii]
MDLEVGTCSGDTQSRFKKRGVYPATDFISDRVWREIKDSLPTLCSPGYYIEPCLEYLATKELMDPGYCSRVPDFTVGRWGYGSVRFLGKTDVRRLDLDEIVKLHRHEVMVYQDERCKPAVGQGLNKAAEVSLILKVRPSSSKKEQLDNFLTKLRTNSERQGASFISFDPVNGAWKFSVEHFSRFGLSEDDEEDIVMDDVVAAQSPGEANGGEASDMDEEPRMDPTGPELSHSLPAHLGLDPVKMKEMRMLMFPVEDKEENDYLNGTSSSQKRSFGKEFIRPPLQNSTQKINHRSTPAIGRKTPLALIEYNPGSISSSSPGIILMAQQNKGMPLKAVKGDSFTLDLNHETPVTGSHSRNIVDAGLFMGRSFRVGWGPNGVLVHCGALVGSNDSKRVLSSVINVEKVAIDQVIRDENKKLRRELADFAFDSPLNLHREIDHETEVVEVGPIKLKLQRVVSNRLMLSEVCRSYIDIVEKHLEVPGLSSSARLVLMHQVMVWELMKVLFFEKESSGQSNNEEEMMQDMKEGPPDVDLEALSLIRRAEFSLWLQESVCHHVLEEVSSLDDSRYLQTIFILLSGRKLDAAVELAASRRDSAGGSTVNRSDVARQLDSWRINGLDFNFIERERVRLYELLAGNIHGALDDNKIDLKRFLGLLMWYHLSPHTSLPVVFETYQHLLEDGKAPFPVPIYVDEGPVEEVVKWDGETRFDLSYYLMLLHGKEESEFGFLKTMFSAFSSTNDPLDYHMIWHQREILEAVGVLSSNDLQVLDMGLISQLLCAGKCHWAIYVVLHMPRHDDYPYLHATIVWEILFQYCEFWSSEESQREFIEELGIPIPWMHEAMAVYFHYQRDLLKALEHYLKCDNWHKAHSIFVTSVAHTLFLSVNHSEIWRLATCMEDHKSEIDKWDLGAGIYVSFYLLRSSLQGDNNTMTELDSLESKNNTCQDFLAHLNESLAVWGDGLPDDARIAYSKMTEEICDLLVSDISDGTPDTQFSSFDTAFSAPIPEDLRSAQVQGAVAFFTCYRSETAA